MRTPVECLRWLRASVDGETGVLVEYAGSDLTTFERDLGEAIGALLDDPPRAAQMGAAGRERAVHAFGWDQIARQTVEVYERAPQI